MLPPSVGEMKEHGQNAFPPHVMAGFTDVTKSFHQVPASSFDTKIESRAMRSTQRCRGPRRVMSFRDQCETIVLELIIAVHRRMRTYRVLREGCNFNNHVRPTYWNLQWIAFIGAPRGNLQRHKSHLPEDADTPGPQKGLLLPSTSEDRSQGTPHSPTRTHTHTRARSHTRQRQRAILRCAATPLAAIRSHDNSSKRHPTSRASPHHFIQRMSSHHAIQTTSPFVTSSVKSSTSCICN